MPNPKITLIGRLGQDPSPLGSSGVRLRVATNDVRKNDKGEWENGETSWWTVKLWKKQSEYAKQVLQKGQEVTIVGTISEESWTDDFGNKKSSYEITADTVSVNTFSLIDNNKKKYSEKNNWDITPSNTTVPF